MCISNINIYYQKLIRSLNIKTKTQLFFYNTFAQYNFLIISFLKLE